MSQGGLINISPPSLDRSTSLAFLYSAAGSVTTDPNAQENTTHFIVVPLFNWMRPDQLNMDISTARCSSVAASVLSVSLAAPSGGEPGAPTNGQPYVVVVYTWASNTTPAEVGIDLQLYFTDPWKLPTLNGMSLPAM